MKLAVVIALGGMLLLGPAAAHAEPTREAHRSIPNTYDGAGDAFKEGGREVGAGFRGVGRGIKGTFTGQRSADEYRKGEAIGIGFKDVGRGIAGGAWAVGRGIKRAFAGGREEGD